MSTYPAKYRYHGKVAENYNISRQSGNKWLREAEIIQSLLDNFQGNISILDVPLGTGRFLNSYSNKRGSSIIGLDVSGDMLLQARKAFKKNNSCKIHLVQGETEKLPLPDSSVDYVICMRLLNWVPLHILKLVLKEFVRVARKKIVVEIRVSRQMNIKDFWGRWIIGFLMMRPWALSLFYKIKHFKKTSQSIVDTGYNLHRETDVSAFFKEIGLDQISQHLVDIKVSFSKRELRPYYAYVLEPKKKC